jgi:tol-pal system protein YbgF
MAGVDDPAPQYREPDFMTGMAMTRLAFLVVLAATLAVPALGQTTRRDTPAPAARAPAKGATAAPSAGGSSEVQLRQRIDQLEEQLAEMQTIIGTLESLARGGAPAAGAAPSSFRPSAGGPMEEGRLDSLETQIRALTSQLERLSEHVRALEGGRAASPAASLPPPAAPMADARPMPPMAPAPAPTSAAPPGFGSTTVRPSLDDRDAIGRIIDGPRGAPPAAMAPPAPENPKQHYEVAYGLLLQQDYAAAQASFEDFLTRYPRDGLSGNAQYWLAETFFVRGQFKAAAQAFLKGYQTYASSPKAPDSLFKLAVSLDRLGQKNDACATFGELLQKFPSAPANIKSRAQTERQRLGCA